MPTPDQSPFGDPPAGHRAEILLRAGTIHTLDPARPQVQALALAGGRIVGRGTPDELAGLVTAHTERIDLGAAVLTPGLVDGHVHPVLGTDLTVGADLTGCTDVDAVRQALTTQARHTAPGDWVRGWGLDPTALQGRPPTAALLDEAVGDRPAMVTMADVHAVVVSSAVLRIAGITGPRVFTSGSVVVCDGAGAPTGHLVESEAVALVHRVLPPTAPADRRRHLREVLAGMAGSGLTGGHVLDGEGPELLVELDRAGQLPLRLRLSPWCHPTDDPDRWADLVEGQGPLGRLVRVQGMKFFLDGTIDMGTAWLDRPDTDGRSTQPYWTDPARYREAVSFFAAHGIPTATHAIGDAAVRYAIDTIGALPRGGVRHRIEHLETVPSDALARCRAADAVVSVQPTHATDFLRADGSDNWSVRLGADRAGTGFRCRDFFAAGLTVVLGSDWPVAPYDPRRIMAAAVLRRPPGRPGQPPVHADQALTAAQALAGYTLGPAAAAGTPGGGRLVVGAPADLTAFGADPLLIAPDELADVPVELTVVDGVVHRGG